MSHHKRRKKLIKPGLQLRLTSVFVLTACAAVLAQFIMLNRVLVSLARKLPEQSDVLMAEWPSMLMTTLGLTIALLVPFILGVGILTTFRIAGPIYRFETYMRQVIRGEDKGPCKIREGDMLQDFCGLLNTMVTALRTRDQDAQSTMDVEDVTSLVAHRTEESAETSVLGDDAAPGL